MKKIILTLLTAFLLLCQTGFAQADLNFAAFNTETDAILEGWSGYSKTNDNSINSANWFTFYSPSRCVGNVLANFPEDYEGSYSPSAATFYTSQNFGSEYTFTGSLYLYQNQVYVYFNSSVTVKNSIPSASGGYRLMLDRKNKKLALQKYVSGSFAEISSISTVSMPYSPVNFSISFNEGQIDIHIESSSDYNYDINYNVSSDSDYIESGYIGFETLSTRFMVHKINVSYNSEKVFVSPYMEDCCSALKGFTIVPKSENTELSLSIHEKNDGDIQKCEVFADGVLYKEMTKENGIYKADYQPDLVGAHKVYVLLTDKYQNKKTLAESILYASDFYAFPALYKNANGDVITYLEGDLNDVTVSFDFNMCKKSIAKITAVAVRYDAGGKVVKIYTNEIENPPLDSMHTVSVNIDAINYGEYITSFLCESPSKPTPMSGGFTLK